jgi:hypothetical protein
MTMETMHLWWWEEDHAPGRTAEEARRWLSEQSGEAEEDCGELDEWRMVPDGEYMREEDGSIPIPAETAAQVAQRMIERWPLRASEVAHGA